MNMTALRNLETRDERFRRMGLLAEPAGYVDGTNLYEYVRSGPTNQVDPLGLQSVATQPTTAPTTSPAKPYTFPGEPPSPYPVLLGNGTFDGTLGYPSYDNKNNKQLDSADFSLHFLPKKGCGCTEIKFEQWVRETRSGAWTRNGSTKGNGGFVIDDGGTSDTNTTQAFYPEDKQNPWTKGTRVTASMTDSPRWSGTYVKREFVVYAVCTKGADAGKSYGTFRWNYTLVNDGGIARGWFQLNGQAPHWIDGMAATGPSGPRTPQYVPNN